MKRIYKLDNAYFYDSAHSCLIVESNRAPWEMVEIIGAIELLFENEIDDDYYIDTNDLNKVICTFYGMKDVKDVYRKFIPLTKTKDGDGIIKKFNFHELDIIQIDLYYCREHCLNMWNTVNEKWLPKGEKREKLKNLITTRNKYRYSCIFSLVPSMNINFNDKLIKVLTELLIVVDFKIYNKCEELFFDKYESFIVDPHEMVQCVYSRESMFELLPTPKLRYAENNGYIISYDITSLGWGGEHNGIHEISTYILSPERFEIIFRDNINLFNNVNNFPTKCSCYKKIYEKKL